MANLGVNIAIFQDGKILLTEREDFEVWCLPGGGVDDRESVAQAALREAREETGLDIALTRLIGIYSAPRWLGVGTHIAVFAARPIGGTLRRQPDEVHDLGFFALDALPEHMMVGQRQRILDAWSGVGGSVVMARDDVWPFDPSLSRAELYALRDASGLSRRDYYLRHVWDVIAVGDERVEVAGIVQRED